MPILALLIYYLQWRCNGQGEIKSLTFPIKVYENPAKATSQAQAVIGGEIREKS